MIALHEIVRQYPKELQRQEFYDQMVKEYLHHYMLQSLFSGKFAGNIAFLGGTALRYFYDIKRFSEDLENKCQIKTSVQLKESLLIAAEARNLAIRKIYDCEHMLFDKNDIFKIRTFTEYIKAFDFSRFD